MKPIETHRETYGGWVLSAFRYNGVGARVGWIGMTLRLSDGWHCGPEAPIGGFATANDALARCRRFADNCDEAKPQEAAYLSR